jgi:cytochrome c oxidase subunit 2
MDSIRHWMLGPQGSAYANDVDVLYMFLVWLSVFFFALIVFLTVYLAWKYRRRKEGVLTPNIAHNLTLELLWSIVPLIIVMGIFFWGFNDYVRASVAPNDAIEVHVTAKKWLWAFEYADGTRTIGNLHVPVNRPVKLILTSEDVLHDFYIPSMRQKTDVIPGRFVDLTFTPTVPGRHQVFCAEYCGKSHSDMMANLFVDSPEVYEKWLLEGDPELQTMPPVEVGKLVYENKGCNSCHSIDGSKNTGPSFKGLYGRVEKFTDGSTVTVDDNYITESINNPQARIVAGYEPVMPTFQGLLRLPEMRGIIAYIKELK